MLWRVMVRTNRETVEPWATGLSQEAAENTAALLRHWMPRSIFGAWAEPEWSTVPGSVPRCRTGVAA